MCGCWTEAQHIAEIAETIDGEDLVAWYAIAEVAVERGEQYENAAAYLQKYLSRPIEGNQPGEASARLHLGAALARLGKQGEAAKELRAALELDSTLEPAKTLLKQMGEKSR
jgi:tetratricopeptide (TPR) repeat protein